MLRKLAISTLGLATAAVALASTALASIPIDPGNGAAPAPVTSTPGGGFPWADVAVGVALGVALAVCLLGVALLARSRRRLATSH